MIDLIGGINNLLSRISSARAAKIDEITPARLAELDAANLPADVDTLKSRVLPPNPGATGTLAYSENSAAEQTVVTVGISTRSLVGGIWLDMVNVTQDTTIRIKHKIDGANYRTFTTLSWLTTDDDGVLVGPFTAYRDIQISLQCGGAGAGAVNVPYAVV